jgi:hypothetical protein
VKNFANIILHLMLLLVIVFPSVVHAKELRKGMPFIAARKLLIQKGWRPINVHEGENSRYMGGIDGTLIDADILEVESCAMDKALCIFNYKKGNKCIRVFTQGEEIKDIRVTHWKFECSEIIPMGQSLDTMQKNIRENKCYNQKNAPDQRAPGDFPNRWANQ